MKKLVQEKKTAIALRRQGLSYNEILKQVPVAKSSLSLWLKDLPLTKDEKQILKKRLNSNISRGRIKAASELRKRRLERERVWYEEAERVFKLHKQQSLFHTGIALYWAEGSKRTDQWSFTNSDADMVKLMILWLEKFANTDKVELFFRLYVHKPYAHENCELWWQEQLNIFEKQFVKTIYKPTQLGVKKRPDYKGCIKIEVRKSKHLLCKMKFWQKMLVEYYRQQ